MAGRVEGKVAFITGAARGQGRAHAVRLAREGADVIALDVCGPLEVPYDSATRADLDETVRLVEAEDRRIVPIVADVRDLEGMRSAVDAAVADLGRLDVVVANAGVGTYGDFLDLPLDELDAMLDINLRGTLYTARATLPHLVAAPDGGDFLSLASVAGLRAFPGEAVYNASKFGMVGFTRALDHEMRERGVRCTSICPGGVATEFAMGTGRTPDMPELEGMMSPEDVAEVVLFTVTRPRSMRIMTTSFRPMSEGSFG